MAASGKRGDGFRELSSHKNTTPDPRRTSKHRQSRRERSSPRPPRRRSSSCGKCLGSVSEVSSCAQVFFLTGADEHGQKISDTAAAQGAEPRPFPDPSQTLPRPFLDTSQAPALRRSILGCSAGALAASSHPLRCELQASGPSSCATAPSPVTPPNRHRF